MIIAVQFAGISAGSSGVPTSGSSTVLTGPLNVFLAPASHAIQTPSAKSDRDDWRVVEVAPAEALVPWDRRGRASAGRR